MTLRMPAAQAERWWGKVLAPGVDFYHLRIGSSEWPNHAFVLKVDYALPAIEVKPVLAWDRVGRLEKVSRICQRSGAVAAINGSFFARDRKPPLPIGMVVLDGKVLQKTRLYRTTAGFTKQGTVIIGVPKVEFNVQLPKKERQITLWGINRPRKANEVILYTSEYGSRTRTNPYGMEIVVRDGRVVKVATNNTPIPEDGYVLSFHGASRRMAAWFEVNDAVKRDFQVSAGWEDVVDAVPGGPRLVADGKVHVGHAREHFTASYRAPNPRTAFGVTYDQKLLFVVVDGRQPGYSVGMTYKELARLMVRLGAKEAMGLDGGGSSVMTISGSVVNYPSDGVERPASNALAVWSRRYDFGLGASDRRSNRGPAAVGSS